MGKPILFKPKSGDYFSGEDVNPPVLPASPPKKNNVPDVIDLLKNPPMHMTKHQEALWLKQIERIAAGNGNQLGPPPSTLPPRPKNSLFPRDQNIHKPPPSASIKEKRGSSNDKDGGQILPPYVRFFLCPDLKRATGNPAWVWTVKVMTEKDGKVTRSYKEFHLIVSWYQFIIGALGGIAVGLETNFFAAARLAQPNIPLPEKLNVLRTVGNFLVQTSSSAYRLSKRALIAGYCFDVVDKNVEEHRGKQDWKNMGISGGIAGAVFGLRGGFRGSITGSLLFGAFGSLAGYQYHRIKQGKSKP